MITTQYTLGFCFDVSRQVVALVKKHKGKSSPNCPEWMEGKLNGIGGKVNIGEPMIAAHFREFHEETEGARILDWHLYAVMVDAEQTFAVQCYYAFDNGVFNLRTPAGGDEEIIISPIHQLYPPDLLENVRWLIPMALEHKEANRTRVISCTI